VAVLAPPEPELAPGVVVISEPEPLELPLPERTAWWGWVLMALGIVAVLVGGWWVLNSPLFDLRSLHVTGNRQLSVEDVRAAAGLGDGTNVLWLSPADVERRLETDPWILRADVERTLPGTLAVSVVERAPVAVVSAGGRMLVAADGTVLGKAGPEVTLPLLKVSRGILHPGDRLSAKEELQVATHLPRQLRPHVVWVERDGSGRLRMSLDSGVVAIYGDPTDARWKGSVVLAVLQWAAQSGVSPAVVDVTAPLAPTLRAVDGFTEPAADPTVGSATGTSAGTEP
jgi:cell division protein FtsQ